MSEIKARYVGPSQTGVDVRVDLGEGDFRHVHVPHGGELPMEVAGIKVPTVFRDRLLEQTDNWTEVKRATGGDAKVKSAPAGKDDE